MASKDCVNMTASDAAGVAAVFDLPNADSRIDPDEVVTSCFDFRSRTRSFDLHQLGGNRLKKKFSNMFHHSSSDGSIKPTPIVSAPSSPKHSPPHQRRRRLVRVVRDVDPEVYGENNPHVVHKYSSGYFQSKQLARQRSVSESEHAGDSVLPYEVRGHTILKKPSSLDHSTTCSCSSTGDGGDSTPPINKHTSFRDEVVVIEFDRKCKVVESSSDQVVKHTIRLHDAVFDDADSYAACRRFEDLAINETIAALSEGISSLSKASVTPVEAS